MRNWLNNILPKVHSQQTPSISENSSYQQKHYPVTHLSQYIGSMLEVYYIDVGVPQIIRAQLCSTPNDECFYLNFGEPVNHTIILYWHKIHADNRVSAVKLIRHQGTILYDAEKVRFNELGPACYMEKEGIAGPVRMMTKEYLRGVFG